MHNEYDVIIVGGGVVGLLLALGLAREDFSVAILEAKALEQRHLAQDNYDLKVSALNLASLTIFDNLGFLDEILRSERGGRFEKMDVWDNVGRGSIQFDCTQVAQPFLGYIVENSVLNNTLLGRLEKYQNVTILDNTKTLRFESQDNLLKIKTDKSVLSAKLVVGADGLNSWVRTQANIKLHAWSYQQDALVATVNTELPHEKTAWQCFLPDGPIAFLPLHNPHTCSIVWSAESMEMQRLQGLSDDTFNREITQAIENRLGQIKKISSTVVYPLTMRHAKEYIKSRIALVGDAAHTLHPLAGQGVNLGFMDAALLCEVIVNARNKRRDWGEYIVLREYERIRKVENGIMILGMEIFKRLFEGDSFLKINLRSLGLNTVNKLDFLKNHFIFYAGGDRPNQPLLAKKIIQ